MALKDTIKGLFNRSSSPTRTTSATPAPAPKKISAAEFNKKPTYNLDRSLPGLTVDYRPTGSTLGAPPAPQGQVPGAATGDGGGGGGGDGGFSGIRDEVTGLFRDWASGTERDTAGLADEITDAEREIAEREYGDVKSALGVQRGEVSTLAGEQKANVTKEGEMGEQELEGKRAREETGINKEKGQFLEQQDDMRDQLARSWRDMSLETQRIARASGRSDTGFAAEKESGLLMNFNRGLQKMAQTGQAAVKDFADAVIETNRYYGEAKNKLQLEVTKQLGGIDTWVRQSIQSIQAQENTALSNKLSQIRQAMLKGNQLKVQTAQAIRDKQLELGNWLAQTQAQYRMAVATAAQGNVASARNGVANTAKTMKENLDLLVKGGLQPVKAANGQYALMGASGEGEDDWVNYGYAPESAVRNAANVMANTQTQSNIANQGAQSGAANSILQGWGVTQPAASPTAPSGWRDRLANVIAGR